MSCTSSRMLKASVRLSKWRLLPAVVLLFLMFGHSAHGWAAAYGSIGGIVRDDTGKPVAQAQVTLEAADQTIAVQMTDSMGRFAFPMAAIGHYTLTVSAWAFKPVTHEVTVKAGYFPFAQIELSKLSEVTVTASRALPVVASITPVTMVSQADIENTPGASNVNSLSMIADYVPGAYQAHDMLHMRGGHQTNWLVDGIEIPNTNIAENLGPAINPQDIQNLGVERGSYAADEGDRTYGIFNVIPKSGSGSVDEAQLDLTAGNFGQTDDNLSIASHTGNFAYYASIEGNRSNLGLQTPDSPILHDASQGYGAFTNLQYNPSPQNAVSFVGQLRQDRYQIPDCTAPLDDDPDCIGQLGDVQGEGDDFALLSWAHTFDDNAVLTSSVFYHFERSDYDGSPDDYPTITHYHHSSQYEGAEESLRMNFSRSHLEVGVYGFGQQDQADFNLGVPNGASPALQELQSPTGGLISAWVQETLEATRWLNLAAGVRETYFSGAITENATDPRLGATIQVPKINWVLSAFWGKYYQAPPLETLSGPLLSYATSSDTAFLPLRGERDTERQFGITIPVQGWSVEADYFVTESTNFFDHNPLGESDIYLPITDQGALIKGRELTVRSPDSWAYGQVHLAYSNQTADCYGSITGGLVVAGTECGGYVALDHDQRNTLNLGYYNSSLPYQIFVSTNLSVNSGLSNGDGPPSHLGSYALLDLSIGRHITPNLTATLTGLNVTNRHLLTDNSLTFGGVHWNEPFQIYAELRYKFRY